METINNAFYSNIAKKKIVKSIEGISNNYSGHSGRSKGLICSGSHHRVKQGILDI